jgi:hypothetical protein
MRIADPHYRCYCCYWASEVAPLSHPWARRSRASQEKPAANGLECPRWEERSARCSTVGGQTRAKTCAVVASQRCHHRPCRRSPKKTVHWPEHVAVVAFLETS